MVINLDDRTGMSPYQNQEIRHLHGINLVVNIRKGLLAMSPSIDLFCFPRHNYFVTFGLKKTKTIIFATVTIFCKLQHVTGVISLSKRDPSSYDIQISTMDG